MPEFKEKDSAIGKMTMDPVKHLENILVCGHIAQRIEQADDRIKGTFGHIQCAHILLAKINA